MFEHGRTKIKHLSKNSKRERLQVHVRESQTDKKHRTETNQKRELNTMESNTRRIQTIIDIDTTHRKLHFNEFKKD